MECVDLGCLSCAYTTNYHLNLHGALCGWDFMSYFSLLHAVIDIVISPVVFISKSLNLLHEHLFLHDKYKHVKLANICILEV